jgi:hypothetical protein
MVGKGLDQIDRSATEGALEMEEFIQNRLNDTSTTVHLIGSVNLPFRFYRHSRNGRKEESTPCHRH